MDAVPVLQDEAMPVGGFAVIEVEAPPSAPFRVSIYIRVFVPRDVLAVQYGLGCRCPLV